MSQSNDFTGDAHWGKGGRYVMDPVTKLRVPVVETGAPAPAEQSQETAALVIAPEAPLETAPVEAASAESPVTKPSKEKSRA